MYYLNAASVIAGAILIVQFVVGCHGAYHYCIDGATQSFPMQYDSDAKEVLMTNVRNKNRYLAHQQCSWEVLMKYMSVPQQVVLQVQQSKMPDYFAVKNATEDCNVKLSMHMKGFNIPLPETWSHGAKLPRLPIIYPIVNRKQKLVAKFYSGSVAPSPNCERLMLVISSVVKGYCGRYMLFNKGNCHMLSGTEQSMEDLQQELNTTNLAVTGFPDVLDVEQFVAKNDRRMSQYPYQRPLNLSSPVRIGVFRCPKSDQAYYWRKLVNGTCVLESANFTTVKGSDIENISDLSTPQCLSLRVNTSGHLVLEFRNCRQSMRSLLSFAETPQQVGARACQQLPLCESEMASAGINNTSIQVIHVNLRVFIIFIVILLAIVIIIFLLSTLTLSVITRRFFSSYYNLPGTRSEVLLKLRNASLNHL